MGRGLPAAPGPLLPHSLQPASDESPGGGSFQRRGRGTRLIINIRLLSPHAPSSHQHGRPVGALGIPLILAIHFLQHRTRVRLTATMFLLESLAPEAATGRNWDRLRSSRALWLQLLAVLLLAWVLAAPCWVRQDAEQTVVFIMDDSANMYPFREEAVQAVAEDMENIGKQGIPTTWVLMGSRPARLPFYRGNNRNAALQSLSRWMPGRRTHDLSESLRTAASMAGAGGLTRLVTCTPERVPAGQPARGVGKPLDNAGFAGITRMEGPGEPRWRIAVKNNSAALSRKASPSAREMWLRNNHDAPSRRRRGI